MANWWLHFSSAYGTFWALIVGVAVIGQTHINTGDFGLYGVPIICAIYAFAKTKKQDGNEQG